MLAEPKPGDGGRIGGSCVVDLRMADAPSCAILIRPRGKFPCGWSRVSYRLSSRPRSRSTGEIRGASPASRGAAGDTVAGTAGRALCGTSGGAWQFHELILSYHRLQPGARAVGGRPDTSPRR